MIKKSCSVLALALISLFPPCSIAQTSTQQAHDQGIGYGQSQNESVGTSRISDETAQQVPFYKQNPVQQSKFDGGFGDMLELGAGRITQSATYESGNCDRENFDPSQVAQDTAGADKWARMSTSARQTAIQNQVRYFDQECDGINFLAGEYETRQQVEIPPSDDIQHWTPDWNPPDQGEACTDQEVTIPPEYNKEYCYESRTIEKRFCQDEVHVQCTPPTGNCALQGIIPGSVSVSTGNYTFSFSGTQMILANQITQPFSQTQANFNFKISGLDRIDEFKAVQINSDNWVGIAVNGRYLGTHTRFFGGFRSTPWTVRMGTKQICRAYERKCVREGGGDAGMCLEWQDVCVSWQSTENLVEYAADTYHSAETGDRYTSAVNINLLPYLREGNNTITMYVIDGGPPGNGTIWINARQKCPPHCDIRWDDNCKPFEDARVE